MEDIKPGEVVLCHHCCNSGFASLDTYCQSYKVKYGKRPVVKLINVFNAKSGGYLDMLGITPEQLITTAYLGTSDGWISVPASNSAEVPHIEVK